MLGLLLASALFAVPAGASMTCDDPSTANTYLRELEAIRKGLDAGKSAAEIQSALGRMGTLSVAAQCGNPELVVRLISAGADPNAQDLEGFTPLLLAAQYGRLRAMRALLDRGASPRATAGFGEDETPLHRAAAHAQVEAARLLLDRGADPNAIAFDMERAIAPADLAARSGNAALVALLTERGARPAPHLDLSAIRKACAQGKPSPAPLSCSRLVEIGVYGHCMTNLPLAVLEVTESGGALAHMPHAQVVGSEACGHLQEDCKGFSVCAGESFDLERSGSALRFSVCSIEGSCCTAIVTPGRKARVTAARLLFHSPAYDERKEPYVVQGDEVWVFNRSGNKTCAAFKSKKGRWTLGWVDTAGIAAPEPMPTSGRSYP